MALGTLSHGDRGVFFLMGVVTGDPGRKKNDLWCWSSRDSVASFASNSCTLVSCDCCDFEEEQYALSSLLTCTSSRMSKSPSTSLEGGVESALYSESDGMDGTETEEEDPV